MKNTSEYKYNHTAWFYEQLAYVYSAGQIRASKASQLAEINAGDKVLYAGVGTGEDAILAMKKGASVTCIDLSGAMLKRAENRAKRAGVNAEFIRGDLMKHDRTGQYDVICANYFLNVFTESLMKEVLAYLTTLLKPGGKIMIADFSIPRGNWLSRAAHVTYYRIANIFYWILAGNDLHPIYDYPRYLSDIGFGDIDVKRFALLGIGPSWFHSVSGRKPL